MTFPRPLRLVLAMLSLLLVAACGGSDHDQADVAFAQQMIPHHRQAVAMARQAVSHDAGPKVRALAARIERAQGPEIARMSGWLDDWDAKQAGHSGHMGAMMSAADMSALNAARGSAFDRLFLTQMIEHHRGALAMAGQELDHGSNKDAQALARSIKGSQAAEIREMEKLLASV